MTDKQANKVLVALVAAVAIVATIAFTTTGSSVAEASAAINEPAPAFTGKTTDGGEISLSDYTGKYVVLEWTNHECPFVKKHYDSGNMQKLQKEIAGDDTVWLSVISSAPGKQGALSADEANALNAERGAAPTAVILDEAGEIGRAYGARTTPHMYIVDPDGKLAYMGAIDSISSADKADIEKAENYVVSALDALKAGETPAEAVTKPYGCSVKY